MKKDIYSKVTKKIIESLENKAPAWEFPFDFIGPQNAVTKKTYQGINFFWLSVLQMSLNYKSHKWITFNQARKEGGCIKKGSKATQIIFFSPVEKHESKEAKKKEDLEKDKKNVYWVARAFSVFNLDQTEGLEHLNTKDKKKKINSIKEADKFVKKLNITIKHDALNQAYYTPLFDHINLPKKDTFKTKERYYATLFHEIVHWTGGPKRLKRIKLEKQEFGSTEYAKEELVAEIGASFMCARFGIPYQTQHTSYIRDWIKVLKNDKKLIFKAAAKAQKACDFLMQRAEHKKKTLKKAS